MPDWATAKKQLYKQLHKLLDPIPYLHFYEKSNIKTINWIAIDGDEAYVLPAYGTHEDVAIFFEEKKRIQIQKGNFFHCQGNFLLATEEDGRGLCFKQLAFVFDQTQAKLVAECENFKGYDFSLYKAYEISREHPFICYVWSGYRSNSLTGETSTITLPVFIGDLNKLLQYEWGDFHLIPMETGQIIRHKDQSLIVKSDEDGIYIDDLTNAFCNKRRL